MIVVDFPLQGVRLPPETENLVRRETGKEQVVRVHYDEGLANRIGPEPCAVVREDLGEAPVGERIGQPLSHEIPVLGADAVKLAEGNTGGRVIASAHPARRGRRTWHVRTLLISGALPHGALSVRFAATHPR